MSKYFLYIPLLFIGALLNSCREDIVIDVEDGDQMIGIYGSISNELKQHQITISRSGDFYGTVKPSMVSGAEVTITDNDTLTITLQENSPGVYETPLMRGEYGHIYTLNVTINENGETKKFYATDTMRQAIEAIDSIKILPRTFNNKKIDDRYKICPYFQTLEGEHTSYMTKVAINGKMVSDTLTEYATAQLRKLAGVYFNGAEMEKLYKGTDFPASFYNLYTKKEDEEIKIGDEITLYIHTIAEDYLDYLNDVEDNMGSSPFFGSPANVRSNIHPEKKALGYFFTAAVTKGIGIVTKESLE